MKQLLKKNLLLSFFLIRAGKHRGMTPSPIEKRHIREEIKDLEEKQTKIKDTTSVPLLIGQISRN